MTGVAVSKTVFLLKGFKNFLNSSKYPKIYNISLCQCDDL